MLKYTQEKRIDDFLHDTLTEVSLLDAEFCVLYEAFMCNEDWGANTDESMKAFAFDHLAEVKENADTMMLELLTRLHNIGTQLDAACLQLNAKVQRGVYREIEG